MRAYIQTFSLQDLTLVNFLHEFRIALGKDRVLALQFHFLARKVEIWRQVRVRLLLVQAQERRLLRASR